jgi:hypothetical protein
MPSRRTLLAALATWPAGAALAHHGWSSFELSRPIWLEGTARAVAWRNPHAELDLEVPAELRVPADLARRQPPAQTANVDGPGLLARARPPERRERLWRVELAPLTRMQAWRVPEIRDGDRIAVLGFELAEARSTALLRAEYLFVGQAIYGLRSSPASTP